jgi:hypothetical protein
MSAPTSDIVARAIRHARNLSKTERYDWLTARAALARILADLETRAPGDPGLDRLRAFIALGDGAEPPPPPKAPRRRRKIRVWRRKD